jgi:hypothetical protein
MWEAEGWREASGFVLLDGQQRRVLAAWVGG